MKTNKSDHPYARYGCKLPCLSNFRSGLSHGRKYAWQRGCQPPTTGRPTQ